MGALEGEVLAVLSASSEAMTPSMVQEGMGQGSITADHRSRRGPRELTTT